MTAPTSLLLLLAMLPAPPDDPDAVAAWYREKYRGELDAAAERHELVYVGLPPWQGRPDAERQRSALRAGLCCEMRGRDRDAARAYDWLRRYGANDEIAALVEFRLRRLIEQYPAGDPVGDLARRSGLEVGARRLSLIRSAMDARIRVLRGQVDTASGELRALEERRGTAHRRLRSVRALRSDLERHGGVSGGVGEPELDDDLQRRLSAALGLVDSGSADADALIPALADALCTRGLRALAQGDVTRGEHLLIASTALDTDEVVAARFVEWIRGGRSESAVASLAQRALASERLRLLDTLLRDIRPLLRRGSGLPGVSERPDHALAHIGQIDEAIAWAAPEIRGDAELEALDRENLYRFERHTTGVDARALLRSLMEMRRMHVRMLVDISVDIVEAEMELLFIGGMLAALDRTRWERTLHGEVQTKLARAVVRASEGDLRGALTALDQVGILVERVRWLDPSGVYRPAGELLRAELEEAGLEGTRSEE